MRFPLLTTTLGSILIAVPLASQGQAATLSTASIAHFRFDMTPPFPTEFGKTISDLATQPWCKDRLNRGDSDNSSESFCRFGSPYLSEYAEKLTRHDEDTMTDWATIDSVQTGQFVAQHIRQQSEHGPFACKNDLCSWVVASSTHRGSYFFCKVERGQTIPSRCEPIMTENKGQVWLAVVVGILNEQTLATSNVGDLTDTGFMFNVRWTRSNMTSTAVVSRVRAALTEPRISLTPALRPFGNAVEASCSPRASQVNASHWEMAQVNVNTDEMENHVGINLELVYWINEQNTEREIDWHMPSSAQKARFFEEIHKNLHTELSALCPAGSWSGETLTCN